MDLSLQLFALIRLFAHRVELAPRVMDWMWCIVRDINVKLTHTVDVSWLVVYHAD
jgi:hypothetical protein